MGSIPPEWAADPVTNLVLRVCRRGMVGPSGPAGRIRVLFDSLTSLGQSHLTELQLLKLLVDCEFNPLEIHHYWHSTTVPPFTVCDGDIGYILGKENEGEKWETLEACSDTKTEVSMNCTLLLYLITRWHVLRQNLTSVICIAPDAANGRKCPGSMLSISEMAALPLSQYL